MEKLLTILLLCFSTMSYGQGFSNLGNTNPNDTARILNNYFLPMKSMRLPAYASVDSNFILVMPGSGRAVRYSISSFLSRIGGYIGSPGLQTVLNNNPVLNTENKVEHIGYIFTFSGTKFVLDQDTIEFLGYSRFHEKTRYIADFEEFEDREIPDAGYVRSLITQNSFDTVMSTTVTSLSSPRFSLPVSTINYAGMTFNSSHFSQVGTTLNFIDLVFYNNQKLTISFK